LINQLQIEPETAASETGLPEEVLAGLLVRGPVVVMPAASRVRPVGLEGVGPAVHEEVEVVRHHSGGRFQRSFGTLCSLKSGGPHRYFMLVVKQ
jgi:hypothetical protein